MQPRQSVLKKKTCSLSLVAYDRPCHKLLEFGMGRIREKSATV